MLATWAKVSRDPRSKPEPGCITIRRPHPRCAVRSGVRCRYGVPLTNAVLLTLGRLPARKMYVLSVREGLAPPLQHERRFSPAWTARILTRSSVIANQCAHWLRNGILGDFIYDIFITLAFLIIIASK